MHVAIIGAGMTGTATAIELLEQLRAGDTVSLIERSGRFGPGLAYSTEDPTHLLNVSADRMSVRADEPGHLVRWLQLHAASHVANGGAASFIPRGVYGRYLSESLAEAATRSSAEMRLVHGEVDRIERLPDGFELRLASGRSIEADQVAICSGHRAAALPVAPAAASHGGPRIVPDPWAGDWTTRVGPTDRLLMIGTGLTMVDLVLTLTRLGHRGPITAISRRGLLPVAHLPVREPAREMAEPRESQRLRPFLRAMRAEIRRAAAEGEDWRPIFDGLRPHLQELWGGFSEVERERFLRHLRPYWDCHRHRMAPAVGERLNELRRNSRLRVVAGRIEAVAPADGEVDVRWRQRGEGLARTKSYDWVVNCTGTESRLDRCEDPLFSDLIESGTVRPGPCGLGLDIDEDARVVDASGQPIEGLYALGPLGRGVLWEITAVGEIREQCASVARSMARAPDGSTMLFSDLMAYRVL